MRLRFRSFLEDQQYDTQDTPFEVEGQQYVLRFFGRPTYAVFPDSYYKKGMVYEIVWFPANTADQGADGKYDRTGGNSVGHIRSLLNVLFQLLSQKLAALKPTGFFLKGADPKLERFWQRFPQLQNFPGYVKSSVNPKIFVRQKVQKGIDTIVQDDDY